jgi:hypothetical protein
MNDSETLTIEPVAEAASAPPPTPAATARRPHRQLPTPPPPADETVRLVAELVGTTSRRAAEILSALGGVRGMAYAAEPDLRAAAVSPSRARLVHAAFELARASIGQPPQRGQRLAGASEVWTHMRARLAGQPVEEFWAIGLDVRHRVMTDTLIAEAASPASRFTRATCSAR